MFEKILVPMDGSELSEAILPYLSALASPLNSDVVLLSVLDPDVIEVSSRGANGPERHGPADRSLAEETWRAGLASTPTNALKATRSQERGGTYISQIMEHAEREAREYLQEVSERSILCGLALRTRIAYGEAASQIVRIAENEGFNLIAMPTHGRNVMGRGVLGSVTDKVVHSGCVPVLTIRPDENRPQSPGNAGVNTVIVPLDGSTLAESVLLHLEGLAQGSHLNAILTRAISDDHVKEEASEYLNDIANLLHEKGIAAQQEILHGNPASSLIELANQTPRSMIALASHGRTGVSRWMLGSVAEELVRSSGRPVLITCGGQKG